MILPNDYSRCIGLNCPHKNDCLRYTASGVETATIAYTTSLNPDKLHECVYFIYNKGE